MSQPIPHYDHTVQPPNGVPGEQKHIDSLVIQTSDLSFAGGQMSLVASPGYNSADLLLPAYNDLTAPVSTPKCISRKPVRGGAIEVQAQAQAVPASSANLYSPSSMISNVPGYTPSSPTSSLPAYELISPVTDVPVSALEAVIEFNEGFERLGSSLTCEQKFVVGSVMSKTKYNWYLSAEVSKCLLFLLKIMLRV
jgi:hypothetical protein